MNLPFGVPALAGPSRLKAGLRTDGTPQVAADILPTEESGKSPADETSAAPYRRHGPKPWPHQAPIQKFELHAFSSID
jgi:hypothetical protein